MLLKNNSQKVIHVGSVMILPEEAKHVDDSLSTAPAVAALISRKALAVVKAPAKETAGEKPGSEPPADDGKNKRELTEECLKLGLDILEDDTKETLSEKIRAATAE